MARQATSLTVAEAKARLLDEPTSAPLQLLTTMVRKHPVAACLTAATAALILTRSKGLRAMLVPALVAAGRQLLR